MRKAPFLLLLLLLLPIPPARAAAPPVGRDLAVAKAVAYLRAAQKADGTWATGGRPPERHRLANPRPPRRPRLRLRGAREKPRQRPGVRAPLRRPLRRALLHAAGRAPHRVLHGQRRPRPVPGRQGGLARRRHRPEG